MPDRFDRAVVGGDLGISRPEACFGRPWNPSSSTSCDYDDRLILLLAPPFGGGPLDPGYIKGYLPGIRENGAQYTHAAAWVVLASRCSGRGSRSHELFQPLNPIHRAARPRGVDRYKVEPYVMAGDVFSQPPHTGRGGWTWYTGSAAWLYRVGLESLLGLKDRRSPEAGPLHPA